MLNAWLMWSELPEGPGSDGKERSCRLALQWPWGSSLSREVAEGPLEVATAAAAVAVAMVFSAAAMRVLHRSAWSEAAAQCRGVRLLSSLHATQNVAHETIAECDMSRAEM